MASLLWMLLHLGKLISLYSINGPLNSSSLSPANVRATTTTAEHMETQGCGGYIKGKGVITSPGYPANFPPYTSCSWVVSADNGSAIIIEFLDFSLDKQISFLHIWDNVRYQNYYFSGSESNMEDLRLSNQIGLYFTSSSTLTNRGFSLMVKSIAVANVTTLSFYSSNTFTSCGNNLTNEGNFTSPNYPAQYPNSAYCTWNLSAGPGKVLQLACLSFDTESDYDSVLVSSQVYGSTVITYNRLSGTSTNCLMDLGVSATVVFTSDSTVKHRGFAFGFRSITPPASSPSKFTKCGGKFSGRGVITSPNFPARYPSNSFCVWYITADGGNRLRFSPSVYNVEAKADFVKIYDSSQINENATIHDIGSSSEALLGRWFGGVYETGPTAVVVFSSDDFIELSGFSLNFW